MKHYSTHFRKYIESFSIWWANTFVIRYKSFYAMSSNGQWNWKSVPHVFMLIRNLSEFVYIKTEWKINTYLRTPCIYISFFKLILVECYNFWIIYLLDMNNKWKWRNNKHYLRVGIEIKAVHVLHGKSKVCLIL